MSLSTVGTSLVTSRKIPSNKTEHDQASRRVILQIQSLLTVLDSLKPDTRSFSTSGETEDFEVYDDDTYRYVSLRLPEDSGHELDLNINDGLMFARIAL